MRRLVIDYQPALGDFIVTLQALECLKQGASHLAVWCNPSHVSLVRFADEVRGSPLAESIRDFDEIYVWGPQLARLVGRSWSELTHINPPPPSTNPALDNVYRRSLLAVSGFVDTAGCDAIVRIPCDGARPRKASLNVLDRMFAPRRQSYPIVGLDGLLRRGGRIKPGDFAVIHPFSSSPRKNWSLAKFQELARKLEAIGLDVLWTCGPNEILHNAVRHDTLYDFACWVSKAWLYIGNDTGPTHLAAATGVQTIILWGPSTPECWKPLGSNVAFADFFDNDGTAYLDGSLASRNSSEELQTLVSELKKARLKMQNEKALADAWKQRAEAGFRPVNPKRLPKPAERITFPPGDPRFDLAVMRNRAKAPGGA